MFSRALDPVHVLDIAPDLTRELASSRWRELNLLLHSVALLGDDADSRTPLLPVLRSAATLVQADKALLYQWDEVRVGLRLSASIGFPGSLPTPLHSQNSQAHASLLHRKPILVSTTDDQNLACEMALLTAKSSLSIPMTHQGRAWGSLQLLRTKLFDLDEAKLAWLFCLVAEGVVPSVVASRQRRGFPADMDAAAGLLAADQFKRRLSWELQRADWVARPLSLLCVEITEMLNSRPRGGTLAFSSQDASRVIDKAIRSNDSVTCMGGQHFLVAMPDASPATARRTGDLIREGFLVSAAGTLPVFDVVVGTSTFPADGRTGEDLIRAACADGRRHQSAGNSTSARLSRSPLAG